MFFLCDRCSSIFSFLNRPLAVSVMVLVDLFVVLMWQCGVRFQLLIYFHFFTISFSWGCFPFFQLGSIQTFWEILDVKLVFSVSNSIAVCFIQSNSSNGFVLLVDICKCSFSVIHWFRRLLLFCPQTRFCCCFRTVFCLQ